MDTEAKIRLLGRIEKSFLLGQSNDKHGLLNAHSTSNYRGCRMRKPAKVLNTGGI